MSATVADAQHKSNGVVNGCGDAPSLHFDPDNGSYTFSAAELAVMERLKERMKGMGMG